MPGDPPRCCGQNQREFRGDRHVAAYLAELDLSKFDPKAPPPKTAAFWDIVDANRAPEDAELADVLDRLGNPVAITLAQVQSEATGDFQLGSWIARTAGKSPIGSSNANTSRCGMTRRTAGYGHQQEATGRLREGLVVAR
jgi:hypothetical protein